jgi:hypothetical protein
MSRERVQPLLVVFRPRNIPRFEEALSKIKVDKLHINYYPQHIAYPLARIEFLKRDYTHFVILTDDLIFTKRDYEILKGECDKYDVISGWANNWIVGPWAEYSSVSFKLPPNPPGLGTIYDYDFAKNITLEVMKEANPNKPIIPVLHQGTMATFLKREIVEKIPFRHDCGCCPDALLATDLYKAGIKQYVDLRVRMLHLKESDNPLTLVGTKSSSVIFEPQ